MSWSWDVSRCVPDIFQSRPKIKNRIAEKGQVQLSMGDGELVLAMDNAFDLAAIVPSPLPGDPSQAVGVQIFNF